MKVRDMLKAEKLDGDTIRKIRELADWVIETLRDVELDDVEDKEALTNAEDLLDVVGR